VFSFDNVDVVVRPMMVTTPLSGQGPSRSTTIPTSSHPLPGTLFGGSPHPVVSGVTRGGEEGGNKGSSGSGKQFCVAHPSLCDHPLTHEKIKFQLQLDTLYVMSSKKGDKSMPHLNQRWLGIVFPLTRH
jgi:hypothetical protein